MREALNQVKEILNSKNKLNAVKAFKDYQLDKSVKFLKEFYDVVYDNGNQIISSLELVADTMDILKVRFEAHKRDLQKYENGPIHKCIKSFIDSTTEEDERQLSTLTDALHNNDKKEDSESAEQAYFIECTLRNKITALRRERNLLIEKLNKTEADHQRIEVLSERINSTRDLLKDFLQTI